MATISRLSVALTANTRRFRRGISSAKNTLTGFVGSIFNVKTAVFGLIGAAGLGLLARNILQVSARFQTLKSSLKTVTGSTKEASKAFKFIQKFAATTPFDLEQVVSAFIKLKALGLTPSEEALKSYGNTASAMGKSLNQMIEAVADASTGEFERLKEFGIKARSEGDRVTFTFQGISKTIGKNAAEIEGYLQDIGNIQFAGAMKEQEENLTTVFSNIGDAWDQLKNMIGESGVNKLVSSIGQDFVKFLKSISPETVKEWTQLVIDAGFELARFVLKGVVWLAGFGEGIKSMKILWLQLQKSVINFGLNTLRVFEHVSMGMDRLLGRDAKSQLASLNSEINDLASTIQERVFKSTQGGLFERFYDPEKTAAMVTELNALREKAEEVKATLGQPSHFLSGELGEARNFLANLDVDLQSQIASSSRILQEEGGTNLKDGIIAGVTEVGKFLDEKQLVFKGEDKAKQQLLGRDPQLETQTGYLKQISGKLDNVGLVQAVAG